MKQTSALGVGKKRSVTKGSTEINAWVFLRPLAWMLCPYRGNLQRYSNMDQVRHSGAVDRGETRTHKSSPSSGGLSGGLVGSSESNRNFKRIGPNQGTLTRGDYRLARSGRPQMLADLWDRLTSGAQVS